MGGWVSLSLSLAPSPTNQPANNLPTLVWWSNNLHRRKKTHQILCLTYTALFYLLALYPVPTTYQLLSHLTPPSILRVPESPHPLDPIFAGMVGNGVTRGWGPGWGSPVGWWDRQFGSVRRPGAALLLLRRKRKRVIKIFVPFFAEFLARVRVR
jgi:hypothetical protein